MVRDILVESTYDMLDMWIYIRQYGGITIRSMYIGNTSVKDVDYLLGKYKWL